MTVSELIEKLQQMPADHEVHLHADWSEPATNVSVQSIAGKKEFVVISAE